MRKLTEKNRTGGEGRRERSFPFLYAPILSFFLAILLAFLLSSLFIRWVGASPLLAFKALLLGAFGSLNGFTETLVKATPLMLAGLGLCVAFRSKVWNIGAEGQIHLGALATTLMGVYLPPFPSLIALTLTGMASFFAGGFWAAIPGWLKVRWGVNEIITTLMMNYIAILGINYAVHVPLKEPGGFLPQSALLQPSVELPILIARTRLHAGILLGIAGAVALHILLVRTTLGYQIQVVGLNPDAGRYSGIPVGKITLLSMILSGGFAGLAGMGEIAGVHHRLMENFSPGYGYTAIVVALLADLKPLAVILVSILFAALIVGADTMQRVAGVPNSLVLIIESLVVLFVLGSRSLSFVRYPSLSPMDNRQRTTDRKPRIS